MADINKSVVTSCTVTDDNQFADWKSPVTLTCIIKDDKGDLVSGATVLVTGFGQLGCYTNVGVSDATGTVKVLTYASKGKAFPLYLVTTQNPSGAPLATTVNFKVDPNRIDPETGIFPVGAVANSHLEAGFGQLIGAQVLGNTIVVNRATYDKDGKVVTRGQITIDGDLRLASFELLININTNILHSKTSINRYSPLSVWAIEGEGSGADNPLDCFIGGCQIIPEAMLNGATRMGAQVLIRTTGRSDSLSVLYTAAGQAKYTADHWAIQTFSSTSFKLYGTKDSVVDQLAFSSRKALSNDISIQFRLSEQNETQVYNGLILTNMNVLSEASTYVKVTAGTIVLNKLTFVNAASYGLKFWISEVGVKWQINDMIDLGTGTWDGKIAETLGGAVSASFNYTLSRNFYLLETPVAGVKMAAICNLAAYPPIERISDAKGGLTMLLQSKLFSGTTLSADNKWALYTRSYEYNTVWKVQDFADPKTSTENRLVTVNTNVTATYAVAKAYTGIDITAATKTIKLTQPHTVDELHDYCRAWLFDNIQVEEFLTPSGSSINIGDWSLSGANHLTEGVKFQKLQTTGTLTLDTGTNFQIIAMDGQNYGTVFESSNSTQLNIYLVSGTTPTWVTNKTKYIAWVTKNVEWNAICTAYTFIPKFISYTGAVNRGGMVTLDNDTAFANHGIDISKLIPQFSFGAVDAKGVLPINVKSCTPKADEMQAIVSYLNATKEMAALMVANKTSLLMWCMAGGLNLKDKITWNRDPSLLPTDKTDLTSTWCASTVSNFDFSPADKNGLFVQFSKTAGVTIDVTDIIKQMERPDGVLSSVSSKTSVIMAKS